MSDSRFDMDKAAEWLTQMRGDSPMFYASVDIRRGGGRICPVDVNLFPAGFNNLHERDAARVPDAVRAALERRGVTTGSAVGVIAESHTRNPYYADHIHTLVNHIRKAGYRAEASCPECTQDVRVRASSGAVMDLLLIRNEGGRLAFGSDFAPDFLLINNDLSAGIPPVLERIGQPFDPPLRCGWFWRRKHRFFEIYAGLAQEFCSHVGIDPRIVSPMSLRVADVDFKSRHGIDRIAVAVETVLSEVRRWNVEHGVADPPTAIVKSNFGTYGMAVMSVTDSAEILAMNRKTVNKMQVGKGKVPTTEVLVQEGIPTDDLLDGCPAEPVVYLIDGAPVGAFYRHHCERGNKYNLNVSGMAFAPIDLSDGPAGSQPESIRPVTIIARLAAIAGSIESTEAAGQAK